MWKCAEMAGGCALEQMNNRNERQGPGWMATQQEGKMKVFGLHVDALRSCGGALSAGVILL